MPTLTVTVNNLNRRTSPVTDFADKSNVVAVMKEGDVFESIEQITNVLGTWYMDRNGYWAWGKGFVEITKPNLLPKSPKPLPLKLTGVNVQQYIDNRFDGTIPSEPIDYNFLLNIPQEIKQTKGKDSVIGILDVPVSTNIGFENLLRPGNIITKVSPAEHSNFIAGIIASKTTSNINGICSMGTILDLSFNDTSGNLITDSSYYSKLTNCIESLDKAMVIINVSYSLDDSVKFAIDKFKELKNVIFVCSAGSDSNLLNIDNCPLAGNPNSISVGTASLDFLNSNHSNIDKRLNIILPILNYVSYNSDGITFLKIPDSSSSWGTAVVSCIIALLYSNNQLDKNSTKGDIISKIQNLSNDSNTSYNFLNSLKL